MKMYNLLWTSQLFTKVKLSTAFRMLAAYMWIFSAACTPRSERLYENGIDLVSKNKFLEAVDSLEDSAAIDSNPSRKTKALMEAARVLRLEIRDYEKSLATYRQVILESEDPISRLQAQESITEIYFENLQDYNMALRELLVLEPLIVDQQRRELVKLRIAQCMQLTGAHLAALEYIDATLNSSKYEQKNFLKIKAQIFVTLKRFDEALKTNEYLLELDPEFFKGENLYISQAMILEEKQEYKLAMDFLNKHRDKIPDQNYFELRIKRLQEQIVNKPFSRGMRK